MLSLTFTVTFLLIIGAHGAVQDPNAFRLNSLDNNYSFGQIRLGADGKTEELIPVAEPERPLLKPNNPSGSVQPLPSPCTGFRPASKIPHPNDKTKFIQCRDQFHYEVFTCPNNGEYDDLMKACSIGSSLIDRCQEEKPCLNGGVCSVPSNATYLCSCAPDWTGDRCEVPMHICATKPCGPNSECRQLNVIDYKQEYICICKGKKEYGPNCLETVPNPCSSDSEQFFPFAFSPRVYIQCDGESLFFQPCGPSLYWNQEEKFCDRKRPNNVDKKSLLKKLVGKGDLKKLEAPKDSMNTYTSIDSSTTLPTPVAIEQPKLETPRNQKDSEYKLSFVPARFANRATVTPTRESSFALNNQPVLNDRTRESMTPEVQSLPLATVDSSQSRPKQWPQNSFRVDSQTFEMNSRTTPSPLVQPLRPQQWQTNTQTARQEPTKADQIQNTQTFMDTDEQQTNVPVQTQTQPFTSQQWSSKPSTATTQNNQRFQGAQPTQQQTWPQTQSQAAFTETSTVGQTAFRPQGFQSSKNREQDLPQTMNFATTNNQPSSQFERRPHSSRSFIEDSENLQIIPTTSTETIIVSTGTQFNTDFSGTKPWQTQQKNTFRVNFNNQQERPASEQPPVRSEQLSAPTTAPLTLIDTSNTQWQSTPQQSKTQIQSLLSEAQQQLLALAQQQAPSQPQKQTIQVTTQQWSSKPTIAITQTNQRFQGAQPTQQQTWPQTQSQVAFTETASVGQTAFRTPGFQSSNNLDQDTIQLTKFTNQDTSDQQPFQSQANLLQELTNKLNNQDSAITSTTWNQKQVQKFESESIEKKKQQNHRESTSFSTNQRESIGNFPANSFDSTTPGSITVPLVQGSVQQSFSSWQPTRTIEQRASSLSFPVKQNFEQTRNTETVSPTMTGSWRFQS